MESRVMRMFMQRLAPTSSHPSPLTNQSGAFIPYQSSGNTRIKMGNRVGAILRGGLIRYLRESSSSPPPEHKSAA